MINNAAWELALRARNEILEHLVQSAREEIRPMLRRQWLSDGTSERVLTGTMQELITRHHALFAIIGVLQDIDQVLVRAGAPRLGEWDQSLAMAVFSTLQDAAARGTTFATSPQGTAATILREADEAALRDCGVRAETAQAIIAGIGDSW